MPMRLKAEAAEWERRSLTAASFPEMVELQRKADDCALLAQRPATDIEPGSPAARD